MKVRLTFEGKACDGDDMEALREVVQTRLEDVADLRLVKVENVDATLKGHYGKYSNVRLTEAEHNELIRLYGKRLAAELVDKLSVKLKTKGYRFRDHFTTIVEWQKEDFAASEKEERESFIDDFFRSVIEAREESDD